MKIIAGKVKGLSLKCSKVSKIRPTSALVRGAMFSSLESLVIDWGLVLDLYAGTGALGIEALSRGAGWADFVERNFQNCKIIRENLHLIGFAEQANVYQLSVRKALSLLQKKYGIIFLDPPYAENTLPVLKMIFSSPLVGENSTVVVEHSHRLLLAGNYENFYLAKFLRHGDACISIYQSIG